MINFNRITELYLQNNDICDITGALSHLPCLRILMLQKNQLPDLYGTLPEIQSLLALQILSKYKFSMRWRIFYSWYNALILFNLNFLT